MIKLAVLDDEKIYLDMISTLLAKYKQEKNVQIRTELFSNANELLEKIELGERITSFKLEAVDGENIITIAEGTSDRKSVV